MTWVSSFNCPLFAFHWGYTFVFVVSHLSSVPMSRDMWHEICNLVIRVCNSSLGISGYWYIRVYRIIQENVLYYYFQIHHLRMSHNAPWLEASIRVFLLFRLCKRTLSWSTHILVSKPDALWDLRKWSIWSSVVIAIKVWLLSTWSNAKYCE